MVGMEEGRIEEGTVVDGRVEDGRVGSIYMSKKKGF